MLREWQGTSVAALREVWDVSGLEAHATLGSTNDRAREAAQAGAPAGTVIIADRQEAGRGQRGRSWVAPPGKSLLASVLLRAEGDAGISTALPLRAGLTIARILEDLCATPVDVKWPNDLVAQERKLAGILCEASTGAGAPFVVVGIGINVLGSALDWPPPLSAEIVTLAELCRARSESMSFPRRSASSGEAPASASPSEAPPSAKRLPQRSTSPGGEAGPLAVAAAVLPAITRLDCTSPLSASEVEELEQRDPLRGRMLLLDGRPAGAGAGFRQDGALRLRHTDTADRFVDHGTVRIAPPRTDAMIPPIDATDESNP